MTPERPARIGAAALLALFLIPLGGLAAPSRAAPSACPEHYFGGAAPDLVRPQLAAETRDLCYQHFAVVHSGVSRTPLAAAEHLTRERVLAAQGLQRSALNGMAGAPPRSRVRPRTSLPEATYPSDPCNNVARRPKMSAPLTAHSPLPCPGGESA